MEPTPPEYIVLRPRHPVDPKHKPEVWAILTWSHPGEEVDHHMQLTFEQCVNLMLDIKGITLSHDEMLEAMHLMTVRADKDKEALP